MKVFYTPVINGEYSFTAQKRLADVEDNEAYRTVNRLTGEAGMELLDSLGYVKVLDKNHEGKVNGYWTYQQDDL